jgi:hypothetical protein
LDSQVDLWAEVLKRYSKFGRLRWICSKKVLSTRRKRNWFKYQFRCGSTLLEGEPMRCHQLLVNQFLNKIKKRNFIHKKGVITKEKPIAPKIDLLV